jgi:hypothetical protein
MPGGCIKLHNDELRNFHSSSCVTEVIKSKSVKWAGHIERTENTRKIYITF